MLRIIAAVIAASLVAPTTADACLHHVEQVTEDFAGIVARAEKQLETGDYGRAKKTLGKRAFPNHLTARVKNVRAIIALRVRDPKQDNGALVAHFKARTEAKATAKDVRNLAWLAEAYLAAGQRDQARPILTDLHSRDLMPDAYGYYALAKVSSGTERYEAYQACRTRAKNPNICELPAEIKSVQARR